MIFFGFVEDGGGQDFGNDGVFEFAGGFEGGTGTFGEAAFGVGGIEYGGLVLLPAVEELAVAVGGVDIAPEDFKELPVGDQFGVVGNSDGFVMSGFSGDNLLIGGVVLMTAGVSADDGFYAFEGFEGGFEAPEAAAGEYGVFLIGGRRKGREDGEGRGGGKDKEEGGWEWERGWSGFFHVGPPVFKNSCTLYIQHVVRARHVYNINERGRFGYYSLERGLGG